MTQAGKLWSQRWLTWTVVAIVLVVGGYFRVVGLNDTSMHSDGLIHDVCKMGVTPLDILVKWEQLLGRTSQMAVPAAIAKLFLDVFHLPPTRGLAFRGALVWLAPHGCCRLQPDARPTEPYGIFLPAGCGG
jgi:hypothetical protein